MDTNRNQYQPLRQTKYVPAAKAGKKTQAPKASPGTTKGNSTVSGYAQGKATTYGNAKGMTTTSGNVKGKCATSGTVKGNTSVGRTQSAMDNGKSALGRIATSGKHTVCQHVIQAWAIPATTTEEVCDGFNTATSLSADHVPYAYRIRGPDRLLEENFESDNDAGAGLPLLRYLRENQIENVAVFVAHSVSKLKPLGTKEKISVMQKAVSEAVKELATKRYGYTKGNTTAKTKTTTYGNTKGSSTMQQTVSKTPNKLGTATYGNAEGSSTMQQAVSKTPNKLGILMI